MKKVLAFIVTTIFLISGIYSQERKVKSEIQSVKIYFNGAEVTRKAATAIPQGNSLLIVEGISKNINAESIQIMLGSGVNILSVEYVQNPSATSIPAFTFTAHTTPKTPTIIKLEDSIEILTRKIDLLQIRIESLDKEYSLLNATKFVVNPSTGFNSQEFEKYLTLNRERSILIKSEIYECNHRVSSFNTMISSLEEKINKVSEKKPVAKSEKSNLAEIRILIHSPTSIPQFSFTFSYLAEVAGWIPLYDIKTEGSDNKAFLTYKAEIAQFTGEIWDNIKISLSSANPQQGISLPILAPSVLSFNPPRTGTIEEIYTKKFSQLNYSNNLITNSTNAFSNQLNFPGTQMPQLKLQAKTLATDYLIELDIPVKFSIPNNGTGVILNVNVHELPLNYQYYAIPKTEKAVFLTGISTDWQSLNILPAFVNMFFQNKFIGKTTVQPSLDNDTLLFSFGRDTRIQISRKTLPDYTKNKLFEGRKSETLNYEITINNTYDHNVNLTLIDQIPVSGQEAITVDNIQYSHMPKKVSGKGILEWELSIPKKESVKVKVTYTVTSPKDKQVY